MLFYIAGALTIGGALGVVTTRNIVYAALALLVSLFGVAGVFLLAFAEFLAIVQVLIYGGAIAVVVLFALMLTRLEDFERLSDNPHWPLAALAGVAIFGLLVATVLGTSVRTGPRQGIGGGVLGREPVPRLGRPFRGRLSSAPGGAHRRRGHGAEFGGQGLIELAHFQVLSAALFAIGVYGVLARRSAVLILMSIELMLNAVNVNLVGFAAFGDFSDQQRALGQVIVVFVITIAAAELALAIAIILRLYRNRSSVNVDEIDVMKW